MNIVSMAASYLTPMIVDKIASSLGISSPLVMKAIGALLPSILGGLLGASKKPDGLGALTKALGAQDPGLLGNLGNLLGGSGQAGLVTAGTSILGSLLGGSGTNALTGAAAKFAGIGDAPAKSLMGLLGPVVLGTLAKQQKDSNLDGAGLAKMLMGQKDNISAALPAGFSDLLKGSGLLDSVMPAMATAQPASRPAATATVHEMPRQPAAAGGFSSLMPWLAGLALAALAGWYFLGNVPRQIALPAAPAITVGSQDIGAQLGTVVEGLRGTLTGITNEGTAREALPRLQAMSKQLDGINDLRGQLPAAGKQGLASYVASLLPILRPMIDKALATSGVGAIAKPVVDQILNRLEAMAKA